MPEQVLASHYGAPFCISDFYFSSRAVLYNFCGLPPPHNDSPLLLQCLIDANVIVQVTPDDSSLLRVAADEDVPLVLNSQHDEWEEFQAPTDIVQVNAAECQFYTL